MNNVFITATLSRYVDKYGTFRYMLNNRRISRLEYLRLDYRCTNPCCHLTTSYRNRKGETCYRHSFVATFSLDLTGLDR